MSKLVVLLVIVAALVLGVITFGGAFVSAYNTANSKENTIVAAREDNEQILAQYGQKVREAAQIPAMQKMDLIEIFTRANEARYGKDGSAADIQWIVEQNPNLDQSTYRQIQQIIEEGRNRFERAQTKLIDAKRSYRDALGSIPTGFMMRIFGYPRIAIGYPLGSRDDYPAISTGHARGAFESGVEEPIQLR